ncbi:hypothetical protein D3C84_1315800 [compost metagenome]
MLARAGVGAAGNAQDLAGLLAAGAPFFQNAHGGAQAGDTLGFAERSGLGSDGHIDFLSLRL